jgi:peptide/nickel transport system substrate-binding protein
MHGIAGLLALAAAATLAAPAAHAGRGADGQLDILYWQAPSTQNPYLSGGTKEVESASLVLEPLAGFDETGKLFPRLVTEIPTVENGGVAEDLTSITWTLKPGLKWSDGTPVTAEDAVFTWAYCTHPQGGCAQSSYFEGIESVEAVDERTIRIEFTEPKPFPYTALVGAESPLIQKAQFKDCLGARAPECTQENFTPIGTGPFVVREFRANDVIVYEANPHYREPDKPAFQTVILKGGGDAAAAARSVLKTGEFDYAWNLQVEPEILSQMEATGKGQVVAAFGTSVERLLMNQTDPDPSLPPDRRSVHMDGANAHPFLADPVVRKAMSMAIDRTLLTEFGYGDGGRPTCNVLPAPELYASTANRGCLAQDLEGAMKLLDEAGIVDTDGDGIREKDGVPLKVLFQTSTNSVRQGTQALIKQWWERIGIWTELRNISPNVFFGGDPASPDTAQKFYADVQMFTNNFSGVDPEAYMANWRCDGIPGPETQWQGTNIPRYCDRDYDRLIEEMARTADFGRRGEIARALNDMLVQSYVIQPLVHRASVSAHSNTLGGVKMSDWDSELWNIQDWHRVKTD